MKKLMLAVALGLTLSNAAAWPEKPVTIVVPFAAGGSTDNVARITADWLNRTLKTSVNVENRTGASGTIAAEYVAQAPADGYTLFMVSLAQMSIVPQMQKVRYDPFKSFTPISVLSTSAFALAVHPSIGATSLKDLVAQAKANPGKLAYGSAGNGSAAHLTMALFLHRAGIEMTHVPYKGVAPAMNDLIGGHVPAVFGSVSEVLRPYKDGKVRVLGVSTDKRLAQMPDVPTVAEQGYPGYRVSTWNGLVAPAAVPKEVLAKIGEALAPACKDSAFLGKFQASASIAWNFPRKALSLHAGAVRRDAQGRLDEVGRGGARLRRRQELTTNGFPIQGVCR